MGNRREPLWSKGRSLGSRARSAFAGLVSIAIRTTIRANSRFASELRVLRDDEQGQAVLEYIIILTATVAGAGLISRSIIKAIDTGIGKMGAQLEKDLKTGRVPIDIWKN